MSSRKYYAGIGSRDCPKEMLEILKNTGSWMARKGFVLRSGGATGSDMAFETGCNEVNGEKEIYLPWKNFNNSSSELIVGDINAFKIAQKFHPNFNMLSQGAKKLQARNSHQVLGKTLTEPSVCILCFTPNGKGSGGTGQALRIAREYHIPIFDFGAYDTISECREAFKKFVISL